LLIDKCQRVANGWQTPKEVMMNDKLLMPKQVAEHLNMSLLKVTRWMKAGKLPHVRLGKLYRVRQSDLEAALQAHIVGQAAAEHG
jgi:excisionase family DNA binding protein